VRLFREISHFAKVFKGKFVTSLSSGGGIHLAEDGEQEGVEALRLRPPHLRPLLRSQGGEEGLPVLLQGPRLPRHL
jgi:hypothetical protein